MYRFVSNIKRIIINNYKKVLIKHTIIMKTIKKIKTQNQKKENIVIEDLNFVLVVNLINYSNRVKSNNNKYSLQQINKLTSMLIIHLPKLL